MLLELRKSSVIALHRLNAIPVQEERRLYLSTDYMLFTFRKKTIIDLHRLNAILVQEESGYVSID